MCVLTCVSVWKGRMAVQGEADTTTSRCLLHKHPGGNYFTTFISHTCFSGRGTSVVAMHQLPRSQTLPHAHIYVRTRIHKHTRKYERSSEHIVHMRVHRTHKSPRDFKKQSAQATIDLSASRPKPQASFGSCLSAISCCT